MTTKTIATALAAAALAMTLGAASASAKGWHHHGFGWGAAGVLGTLTIGAIVASESTRNCYYVTREQIDGFGNVHLRKVLVCE